MTILLDLKDFSNLKELNETYLKIDRFWVHFTLNIINT